MHKIEKNQVGPLLLKNSIGRTRKLIEWESKVEDFLRWFTINVNSSELSVNEKFESSRKIGERFSFAWKLDSLFELIDRDLSILEKGVIFSD